MQPLEPAQRVTIESAISLITRTPGYEGVGQDLTRRLSRGWILSSEIPDRAHAGLTGRIYLGAEPFVEAERFGDVVGVAETLVHEAFHMTQFPLEKTVSFWTGVATGTPVMRRYERPAYRFAVQFLQAVANTFPDLTNAADREIEAVRMTYRAGYGEEL